MSTTQKRYIVLGVFLILASTSKICMDFCIATTLLGYTWGIVQLLVFFEALIGSTMHCVYVFNKPTCSIIPPPAPGTFTVALILWPFVIALLISMQS